MPPEPKLERILVPMDFSTEAHPALPYAVMLATQFQARIVLLHIVELVSGPVDPTFGYVPVAEGPQVAAAEARLKNIGAQMALPEILESTEVRLGVPYHQITVAAKDLNIDLIVITTHGHTGLSHVFLGSTAERIVRHAPCPVLTVRRR